MFSCKIRAAAVVLALSMGTWSMAGTLVDFKPLPVSTNIPEFVFNGPAGAPSFQTGPGSIGNADGVLPVTAQTPGGLDAEASFVIPGIPGSGLNVASTEFFDSTLTFTGLVANAPPIVVGPTIIQQLGPGSFTLVSTDPDGVGPLTPTVLLQGNIGLATFIVGTGNSGAAFNSGAVNYTGGVIYNALVASGASPNNNSMSVSMVDVTPGFAIGPDGFLGHFSANGTGLFNYTPVPEPASLAMLALGACGMAIGRRR